MKGFRYVYISDIATYDRKNCSTIFNKEREERYKIMNKEEKELNADTFKYCVKKWDENKSILEKALLNDPDIKNCDYKYIIKLVVRHILNEGSYIDWDEEHITVAGDHDYQGTMMFLIPRKFAYAETEYLVTHSYYGSCGLCDSLFHAQQYCENIEDTVREIMMICKDIICHIKKPYCREVS